VCQRALLEWIIEVWELFVRGEVRRAIADTWPPEAKTLFKLFNKTVLLVNLCIDQL
jgi:hypothetical protein